MTKAEIGMIHLEAKEHQEFPARPEAERKAWNRFSSRTLKENIVLPKPWFWTSGLKNCERIILCFKPLIFWHCYHSPRKQYNTLIQSTTVSLWNYQEHPNWSCKHRLFSIVLSILKPERFSRMPVWLFQISYLSVNHVLPLLTPAASACSIRLLMNLIVSYLITLFCTILCSMFKLYWSIVFLKTILRSLFLLGCLKCLSLCLEHSSSFFIWLNPI